MYLHLQFLFPFLSKGLVALHVVFTDNLRRFFKLGIFDLVLPRFMAFYPLRFWTVDKIQTLLRFLPRERFSNQSFTSVSNFDGFHQLSKAKY